MRQNVWSYGLNPTKCLVKIRTYWSCELEQTSTWHQDFAIKSIIQAALKSPLFSTHGALEIMMMLMMLMMMMSIGSPGDDDGSDDKDEVG